MTRTTTIALDGDGRWKAAAVAALRAGNIVGVPTETVYGLAGDATSESAVASIYAAKGRPSHNPLIVHVADADMAERYAAFSDDARDLAEAFWPGPLTIVLPLRRNVKLAAAVTAGGDSLAIRCPQGPLRELAEAVDRPIAAPSANKSGHVSSTSAQHVLDDLGGQISLILDGGPSSMGLESTIIDMRGAPRILRPGALPSEDLSDVLGKRVSVTDGAEPDRPVAPGLLSSHYAPSVPVRLDVLPEDVRAKEAYLGFGEHQLEGHENLSPSCSLDEAASALYAALRRQDRPENAGIAVAPLPRDGLGEALANRLKRAAAPRG